MLLSAQRVRSALGLTGINLYVYRHPAGARDVSNLGALEETAELVMQSFEVPPGRNTVTSYLDIFAPEGTHAVEVAKAAATIRAGADPVSFPVVQTSGGMVFRLGLVFGLVPSWRNELTDLVSRLILSTEDPQ